MSRAMMLVVLLVERRMDMYSKNAKRISTRVTCTLGDKSSTTISTSNILLDKLCSNNSFLAFIHCEIYVKYGIIRSHRKYLDAP